MTEAEFITPEELAARTAHARFVEPAMERCEIWRLILGVAVFIAAWLAIVVALGVIGILVMSEEVVYEAIGAVMTGDSPYAILYILALFAPFWPAIWLTVRFVHNRKFVTLIGPDGFRIGDFTRGIACIGLFAALALLLSFATATPLNQNMEFGHWLSVLPIALVLLFLQTGAEELFFRGYLQQQIAARAGTVMAILFPSVLFGLGHINGAFGANMMLVVVLLTISGLIAADVTRRTGNLSFAMGLHFANNVLAILLIGYEEDIRPLSLWIDPTPLTDETAIRVSLLVSGAMMLVVYAALVLLVARRIR